MIYARFVKVDICVKYRCSQFYTGAVTAMDFSNDPASVRMLVAGKATLFLTMTGKYKFWSFSLN